VVFSKIDLGLGYLKIRTDSEAYSGPHSGLLKDVMNS